MNQELRIGITGATGLIGTSLRALIDSPVVLTSRNQISVKANEELLMGSFSDEKVIDELTKKVNVLIHTATLVGPRSEYDLEIIQNDLVGSIHLAQSFFDHNPNGHFIYLSTSGGLYDLKSREPKTEGSEIVSNSLYGAVKLIIENVLHDIKGPNGKVTILRPTAVYGNCFKKNLKVGLIDKIIRTMIDKTVDPTISIFDNLESGRDYLYVDDMVDAILAVVKREKGSNFEIYNVGTGNETSIQDVLNLVERVSERLIQTHINQGNKPATSLIVMSDKLFRDTSWKAKTSLEEGVRLLLKKSQRKEIQ